MNWKGFLTVPCVSSSSPSPIPLLDSGCARKRGKAGKSIHNIISLFPLQSRSLFLFIVNFT